MRSKAAPAARRRRFVRWLILFVFLAGSAYLLRDRWLPSAGFFLIRNEEPLRDAINVVLAGDDSGLRLLKASQLVDQGYGTRVYVSSHTKVYGIPFGELAVRWAVAQGLPEQRFVVVYHTADSTREEAGYLVKRLRADSVRRFNLITSDFHTRRSGRIFDQLAGGVEFRVVAAPTSNFRPEDWWRTRPAQKQLFMEYTKTVADWLGI